MLFSQNLPVDVYFRVGKFSRCGKKVIQILIKRIGRTTKKIKTVICLSGVIKIQRLKFSHALPRLLRKKAQT